LLKKVGMENELQHGERRCFVISKLQNSPQQSTHVIHVHALPIRWIDLDPCMGGTGFLSSLVEDDYDWHEARRINWRAVGGMAIALALGAGFWAGFGLLISRMA